MGTRFKGTNQERAALNLYISLMRAAQSVDMAVNFHLREHGLTERQFAVLEALLHVGPMRQNELAEKMLCTPGNMTGVLSKLEKMKLVKRTNEKGDRRCQTVHLTAPGAVLIKKIFPGHVQGILDSLKGLSAHEHLETHTLLKKLGLYAQRMPKP